MFSLYCTEVREHVSLNNIDLQCFGIFSVTKFSNLLSHFQNCLNGWKIFHFKKEKLVLWFAYQLFTTRPYLLVFRMNIKSALEYFEFYVYWWLVRENNVLRGRSYVQLLILFWHCDKLIIFVFFVYLTERTLDSAHACM